MESILTITTPAGATGFDLTTAADVKSDLDITAVTYDTLLGRYVTEASHAIARACGRVLGKEVVSELFRTMTERPRALLLQRWPIASVTTVTEDGAVLTATDWEVDKESGILFRLSGDARTCWNGAKIVVAYEGGYTLPASSPPDLQKAARMLVKGQWQARKRDPSLRSEQYDDLGEKTYWVGNIPGAGDALPAEVEELIAPYRDIRV